MAGLTYKKREHIFPAGLGGLTKLPIGFVSDEANEHFSPHELRLLRYSFVSVNRNNFGPGKRGSLNIKKIKNPVIRVLKSGDEPSATYTLGFVFKGESHIIPQIILNFNDYDMSCGLSFTSKLFNEVDPRFTLLLFQRKLIDFLINEDRKFTLINMPYTTNQHFISIGCYKGKWFAATSHNYVNMNVIAAEFIPNLIEEYKKNAMLETDILIEGKKEFNYSQKLDINFNELFLLYAKTAFNALAHLKGHEFVLDEQFNKIRDAILSIDGSKDMWINKNEKYPELVKDVGNKSPNKSHFVVIKTLDNILYAYVSFYGEPPVIIKLSDKYQNDELEVGFICDWKNRREMTLHDLMRNEK